MPVTETLKKIAEKTTGWARPGEEDLVKLVRPRKPHTYRFKDDGIIPKHPRWPLVIYVGQFGSMRPSIRRLCLKNSLSATAGAIPGVTASTTMFTIIRALTRCSVSPAARRRCSSAD